MRFHKKGHQLDDHLYNFTDKSLCTVSREVPFEWSIVWCLLFKIEVEDKPTLFGLLLFAFCCINEFVKVFFNLLPCKWTKQLSIYWKFVSASRNSFSKHVFSVVFCSVAALLDVLWHLLFARFCEKSTIACCNKTKEELIPFTHRRSTRDRTKWACLQLRF